MPSLWFTGKYICLKIYLTCFNDSILRFTLVNEVWMSLKTCKVYKVLKLKVNPKDEFNPESYYHQML